ncbi:MAG: hypothetical protein EOP80_09635 [Variovorax sp.]|nr:MAG: hypothetical protein EOP80_09635 [Variovorax sp.]
MSLLSSGRTLGVSSPGIPLVLGRPALEPVRLSGHEGVNGLFAYELLLKTPDALNLGASGAMDFDLDSFIGREISCLIELDGAGTFILGAVGAAVDRVGAGVRQINALITDACLWGEEGRHVQYKLTLRPWLHLATLATDCKIYQNKSVVEVLDELLGDYPFPVDKRQTQYNESDFEFFTRLCQEWGINYFFEHSEDIGHRPSVKEAWISVTQWYPAFQHKGAIGNISDGITLLILPLILVMFVGNFLGQCLTWQARFPKEIENAGQGD